MSIPLVDLKAQYAAIREDIAGAIDRVLANTSFILGDEVEQFEQAFGEFLGVDHVVGVSSGTSALHLALLACGIGAGDEVVVPGNTFIATAEAVLYVGGTPVFADVNADTFTMDAEHIEPLLTAKTRAIIPVHLYGHPANMGPIMDMASDRGLVVIEDAAQAHGAEYCGDKVGSFGRAACFSFYPGKNLGAYGDGGAVVTRDAEVAEQVRLLRNHGRAQKYEHLIPGYNYRLDALQAAILGVKLDHLPKWNEARRRHAQAYTERLRDLGTPTPVERDWATHVYHIYAIQVADRDAVAARLKADGIATGIHYPIPIHLQPALSHPNQQPPALPICERLAPRLLSLPMYPELTIEQIDRICAAVAGALG